MYCKKFLKKYLTSTLNRGIIFFVIGVWRSLVAHLNGVQGVASSNLVAPIQRHLLLRMSFFVLENPQLGWGVQKKL